MIKYNPGVYFLIKDMDVIYIGQSIQMEYRVKNHKVNFDTFVLVPCKNRQSLEREMVMLIKPVLNKMWT